MEKRFDGWKATLKFTPEELALILLFQNILLTNLATRLPGLRVVLNSAYNVQGSRLAIEGPEDKATRQEIREHIAQSLRETSQELRSRSLFPEKED